MARILCETCDFWSAADEHPFSVASCWCSARGGYTAFLDEVECDHYRAKARPSVDGLLHITENRRLPVPVRTAGFNSSVPAAKESRVLAEKVDLS